MRHKQTLRGMVQRHSMLCYYVLLSVVLLMAYACQFVSDRSALKLWLWWVVLAGCVYIFVRYARALNWLWYISVFMAIDIGLQGMLYGFFGDMPVALIIGDALSTTDSREIREFMQSHWRLIVTSLVWLAGQTMVFVLWRRYYRQHATSLQLSLTQQTPWQSAGLYGKVAMSLLVILTIALHCSPTMQRNHPIGRWVYLTMLYIDNKQQQSQAHKYLAAVQQQAQQQARAGSLTAPRTARRIIVVIGESSNRNNWSAYGYRRATTAPLEQFLQSTTGHYTWFSHARSNFPSTSPSLQTALTRAPINNPKLAMQLPDIFTQLLQAGFAHSSYLSTQPVEDVWLTGIGKSFAYSAFINQGNSRHATVTDLDLLPLIHQQLAQPYTQPQPTATPTNTLIVIHTLGQHFDYAERCPQERQYTPFSGLTNDIIAKQMQQAGRLDYIISQRNYYDNAVYCTAVLLRDILQTAQDTASTPTAVLYFADHGQEVGHNSNNTGHSAKYDSGFEVPILLWTSANWTQPWQQSMASKPFELAQIDDVIAQLAGIRSPWVNPLDK